MKDFFKNLEQNTASAKKTQWGGTGSLPALGGMPAQPALPEAHLPPDMPTNVAPPSPEAILASNQIIEMYSKNRGQ